MKSFYSCIDARLPAPQSEQHLLISRAAEKAGGQIVFYGAEDFFSSGFQPFILPKLKRTPNIDGVIFFTIDQFCYGHRFNAALLKDIINLELIVCFAREHIALSSMEEVRNELALMQAYFHANNFSLAGITGSLLNSE